MLVNKKIRKKHFLRVLLLLFVFEVSKIFLLILQDRFDVRLLVIPVIILILFRVVLSSRRMLASVPVLSRLGAFFIVYCMFCIPVEVIWLYYQISTLYYTGHIPLEVACLGTQLITVMETLSSFLSPSITGTVFDREVGCLTESEWRLEQYYLLARKISFGFVFTSVGIVGTRRICFSEYYVFTYFKMMGVTRIPYNIPGSSVYNRGWLDLTHAPHREIVMQLAGRNQLHDVPFLFQGGAEAVGLFLTGTFIVPLPLETFSDNTLLSIYAAFNEDIQGVIPDYMHFNCWE